MNSFISPSPNKSSVNKGVSSSSNPSITNLSLVFIGMYTLSELIINRYYKTLCILIINKSFTVLPFKYVISLLITSIDPCKLVN